MDRHTASNTHDLLDCSCRGDNANEEECFIPAASDDDEEQKGFVVASEVKIADFNQLNQGDREVGRMFDHFALSFDTWISTLRRKKLASPPSMNGSMSTASRPLREKRSKMKYSSTCFIWA